MANSYHGRSPLMFRSWQFGRRVGEVEVEVEVFGKTRSLKAE